MHMRLFSVRFTYRDVEHACHFFLNVQYVLLTVNAHFVTHCTSENGWIVL